MGTIYLTVGVFFSSLDLDLTDKVGPRPWNQDFYDYSGVLNVHSKKSSGSGKVQDIIAAASEAELDFLFFNESDPVGRKQPRPIKFGNVHVFYGSELNYRGSKFLHTSTDENFVFSSNSDIQLFISNHLETGGEDFLVLAHPDKSDREWTDERPPNFISGLEVLNLREAWKKSWEEHTLSFIGSLIFYPFNPSLFFLDIYSDESLSTKLWDRWSEYEDVHGFLGSDVTSKFRITKGMHINFPSYKNIFLMAQNHVLLTEELLGFGNHEKIFKALKKGQSYFSIDILGDPKGFSFWGSTKKGKMVLMGESVNFAQVKNLNVKIPQTREELKVLLYHNGDVVRTESKSFQFTPKEKGSYRVEIRVNPRFPLMRHQEWIPWIFSNPIFIKSL